MCDIITLYLPFPFPGSVLSMVVLFLCLLFGIFTVRDVEPVADFLLKNMALVFVPATVSIISYTNILKNIIWQFLAVCAISTVITFVCTAYAVKLTIYFMNKRKEKKNA